LGDELFVGGEKIVLAEFARKNPGDLFEGDWLDGVVGDCCGEETIRGSRRGPDICVELAEFD